MSISSKQEAFKILEKFRTGIPFEAIRFLMDYGKDEEILDKVVFHLENAYDKSIFYDERTHTWSNAPLWYAIVAEGQIDERLIDPIIQIYTITTDGWDFLDEQGLYVLGKLCAEFGDVAIEPCVKKSVELSEKNSELPYLYLFESLEFAKEGAYDEEILTLLKNPRRMWLESLLARLGNPKYQNILPRLRELESYYKGLVPKNIHEKHTLIEINGAIEGIEAKEKVPAYDRAFYQSRSSWEKHYKRMEENFLPDSPKPKLKKKKKKIGRNDPCPCGSGKKYKKCCLN